ncbi:hypothetical protein LJC22_01885 [Desulfosarcina sp. OttesenSCG-928-G10]|nr:hypothetical protein [Desulfosarcina sp. OttesenSCG-928-G10]
MNFSTLKGSLFVKVTSTVIFVNDSTCGTKSSVCYEVNDPFAGQGIEVFKPNVEGRAWVVFSGYREKHRFGKDATVTRGEKENILKQTQQDLYKYGIKKPHIVDNITPMCGG